MIAGEGAPIALSEIDTHVPDGVEIETHEGGSRAGGGCWRRSSADEPRRRGLMRSFAGGSELTPAQLREAPVHWPRPSVLDASLEALDGVGPKSPRRPRRPGSAPSGDLLMHLPHRHRDRQVRQLGSLEPGESGTVRVEVLGAQPRPFRKGRLTFVSVKVGDDSAPVKATWFNQPWVGRKAHPRRPS